VSESVEGASAFKRAWDARETELLIDWLTEDVTVRSPLIAKPFTGRTVVAELYDAVFEAFERLVFTDEAIVPGGAILRWNGVCGGRSVDGIDVLTTDTRGRIREIRVYIRPLTGLGVFGAAAGPAMARRRSGIGAGLLRVSAPGLRVFTAAVDAIASRALSQRAGETRRPGC
jgi:hypothetical protein